MSPDTLSFGESKLRGFRLRSLSATPGPGYRHQAQAMGR